MEYVIGLFSGVVAGVIITLLIEAGNVDAIVKMYADKQRLYRVGDKAYEIKEV